ncbi:MAG TPA: CaiB/BaiF CoA-transferase family protein [Candidatus Limnocylindrales bacterium]|nr:CaiB/BaiF CoA-transferase family protein [Candidatus Limnocylindrales bacterium]
MGPLSGIRVIEMAGLAPAPYAGMLLADFGADVVRVDRSPTIGSRPDATRDYLARGKRSIGINMKHPRGVETLLALLDASDVVIDPFRPGVMEKLGAGPDVALARNPGLVFARLTGWGQDGPYASMAGHDIDYIAISGALSLFGRPGDKPLPPINLLGDFAGGGMLCALGIVLALFERSRSGKGQVIDSAMVDGAAHLTSFLFGFFHAGFWSKERGTNLLDTGAPFYDTYRTADGEFMAVGAIEPQFYAKLLEGLGLDADSLPHQMDRGAWAATRELFTKTFATRTRAEWSAIFDGTDACVAPVLGLDEAAEHPANVARNVFVDGIGGKKMPAPAPRLSRTPGSGATHAPLPGAHTDEVLASAGLATDTIAELRGLGAVG